MKSRALWVFVVVAALVLAAVLWWRNQAAAPSPAGHPAGAQTAVPGSPAPKAKPEVSIEDGKTIDFSSGVPIVKDDAKEKAAIERSVKAMEEAAKEVTFGPPPPAPTKTTAVEPEKK
jgi:hypothetical protein